MHSAARTDLSGRRLSAIGSLGVAASSLVAANAGLAILYFISDLTLFQLVVVYWWEILWIGAFSVLRLLVASLLGNPYGGRRVSVSRGASLLLSIVAIVFLCGKFLGLFLLSGAAIALAFSAVTGTAVADLMLPQLGLLLGISGLLFAGHALGFVATFLARGEFRHARATALLAEPFLCAAGLLLTAVLALCVTQLLPGVADTALLGTLLIVAKLAFDLGTHSRRHPGRRADPADGAALRDRSET